MLQLSIASNNQDTVACTTEAEMHIFLSGLRNAQRNLDVLGQVRERLLVLIETEGGILGWGLQMVLRGCHEFEEPGDWAWWGR